MRANLFGIDVKASNGPSKYGIQDGISIYEDRVAAVKRNRKRKRKIEKPIERHAAARSPARDRLGLIYFVGCDSKGTHRGAAVSVNNSCWFLPAGSFYALLVLCLTLFFSSSFLYAYILFLYATPFRDSNTRLR